MPRDLSAYVDDVLDDDIAASTEPEREFSLGDVRKVPSRRWLEFGGGVISGLSTKQMPALGRRWRSRQ
jgi:hypothetical protein